MLPDLPGEAFFDVFGIAVSSIVGQAGAVEFPMCFDAGGVTHSGRAVDFGRAQEMVADAHLAGFALGQSKQGHVQVPGVPA